MMDLPSIIAREVSAARLQRRTIRRVLVSHHAFMRLDGDEYVLILGVRVEPSWCVRDGAYSVQWDEP